MRKLATMMTPISKMTTVELTFNVMSGHCNYWSSMVSHHHLSIERLRSVTDHIARNRVYIISHQRAARHAFQMALHYRDRAIEAKGHMP